MIHAFTNSEKGSLLRFEKDEEKVQKQRHSQQKSRNQTIFLLSLENTQE